MASDLRDNALVVMGTYGAGLLAHFGYYWLQPDKVKGYEVEDYKVWMVRGFLGATFIACFIVSFVYAIIWILRASEKLESIPDDPLVVGDLTGDEASS